MTAARRATTGYAKSQHARPRIEPAFGWLKTIAWMRKVKLRGLPKVDWLLRVRERRLQSDPAAEAAAEARLMGATCLHRPARSRETAARRAREDVYRHNSSTPSNTLILMIDGFSAASSYYFVRSAAVGAGGAE